MQFENPFNIFNYILFIKDDLSKNYRFFLMTLKKKKTNTLYFKKKKTKVHLKIINIFPV